MKRTLTIVSAIGVSLLLTHSTFSQTTSREDIKKKLEQKRLEIASLEDQFLAPSEADRAAYAQLLSQPDSGLIRLLPREKYESEIYRDNPKTMLMRGGGAYYSFTTKAHEYGRGSDISLEMGRLSVGFAGANYGMLHKVGAVPLSAVTLEHGSVRGLVKYETVTSEPDARVEQQRFSQGAEIDGAVYKRTVPLEVGATYVLRSIDFYSTSDVLVAFHVVRQDDDGSAIIAWRLLKKYATPKLARTNQAESQIR